MNIDKSKIKGIIFDYGGTLDTGGRHWSEVLWDGYRQAGVEVDKAGFREAYVYAGRELASSQHIHDMLDIKVRIELEWLVRQGLFSPDEVEAKGKEIAQICYDFARKTVHASEPVLQELSEKYPLVLVSNFYGNIETVLEDFGIRKYFKDIIESAVLGIRKPDPRIFEHGVKSLGILPEQTLVIGDSLRKDIEPAESLGCQVLWIKGEGWTKEEDEQTHPNTIYALEEAKAVLL